MRIRVLGTRELDFVSNGEKVQGTQIFFSHPAKGVDGEQSDKLFIRHGFPLPQGIAPGKILDVFCDTKGHVEAVQVVSAPAGK